MSESAGRFNYGIPAAGPKKGCTWGVRAKKGCTGLWPGALGLALQSTSVRLNVCASLCVTFRWLFAQAQYRAQLSSVLTSSTISSNTFTSHCAITW